MPRTQSGEPIHRQSREAGTFEKAFWKPLEATQARQLQLAAERYSRRAKKPGERSGPLGHIALEVLGLFARLQQATGEGRLDCSYLWMAKTLRRSIDAVWRALRQLEEAGVVEWERRFTKDGPGTAWRQYSNAYRLVLAATVMKCLPAVMAPAPVPVDHEHASATATASNATQVRELPHDQWARTEFDDEQIAAAMERFRRKISDSAKRNESPPVSLLRRSIGVALPGDTIDTRAAPSAPQGLSGGRTAKPAPS
jgi:hypothetical protein